MVDALWQQQLVPASFNGINFYIELQVRAGGGRLVPHEFPKKNIPWVEPMGRRVRHWPVTGYLIYSPVNMPDVFGQRDDLISALESGTTSPGVLVLPTGLQNMSDEPPGQVYVDTYSVIERQERGGWVEFEMVFIEAGQTVSSQPSVDTVSNAIAMAQGLNAAAPQSSDLSSGPGGIGSDAVAGGSASTQTVTSDGGDFSGDV